MPMHDRAELSRRGFLSLAAAGGAAMLPLSRLAFASEDKSDPYRGLPIGIQSYTLRNFNLNEALRHIRGLNLHFVEFFSAHFPLDASAEKIAEMKDLMQQSKLKITAHGVTGFAADHEANRKVFEFAKAAGIKNVTADPAPESFESLDKLVEEYDIRIAIHNHGPGARYDGLDTVQKAVKDHHPLIGACVDTGHVLRSAEDPVRWIRELGPRVFALHVKDVAEKQDRTHDVIIGSGHLDVVGMFAALKEIKFPSDGSLSLEYESNPDNPMADVEECLAVAREAIPKAGW